MLDSVTLAAFSLTALALVVSPGPDTMLIIRYGLTSGPRAAFAAVAGVQLGLVVHTLLAVAGISALIAASPTLFRTLAIAGASYLGWLGINGLRATATFTIDAAADRAAIDGAAVDGAAVDGAAVDGAAVDGAAIDRGSPPVSVGKACRDAVLTNILNPKVILLFVALYPNFVKLGRGDVTSQLLALSAILIVINVMWQVSLAWAAKSVRRWLKRPQVQRFVSRLTGAILLVFAVLILYQHAV